MEKIHREVLSSNMAKLADEIDVDDFLDDLRNEEILTEVLTEDIESEKSRRAKTGKMVILLQSCGPKAFKVFRQLLKKKGHTDIALKMKKDVEELKMQEITRDLKKIEKSGQIPMEAYGDILALHREEVVEDLWVEHIMPLMAYPVDLSEGHVDEIKKHTSRKAKAETLFDIMKMRVDYDGKKAFYSFCDVIGKVYPHLAHQILKDEVKTMVAVSRPTTKVGNDPESPAPSRDQTPSRTPCSQREEDMTLPPTSTKQVSFRSPRPSSNSPKPAKYKKTPLPDIMSPITSRSLRSPVTSRSTQSPVTGTRESLQSSRRTPLPKVSESLAKLEDQLNTSVKDRYERWLGIDMPERTDMQSQHLDRATKLIIEAGDAIEKLESKIKALQRERDEAFESRDQALQYTDHMQESLRQLEKEKEVESGRVQKLSEYIIRPGSTPGGRGRRVTPQKFRPFSLRIRKSKTVDDIKEMVKRREGIPSEWQQFYYNGKLLKDHFTLREQNVYDQSKVDLKLEVPEGVLPLIIKTVDDDTHVIAAEMEDTIAAVKARIYDKEGIPPHQIRLVHGGINLDNNRTLREYGIESASTLHMVMRYNIMVRSFKDKTISLQVGEADSIKKIKMLVNEKLGIAPEMQRIVFSGKVLENSKCLADYHIWENSVLSLVLTVSVLRKSRLDFDEEMYNVDLDPRDNVVKLKRKLEEMSGVEAERQHLVLDDVYLTNYDRVAPYAQKGKTIIMYVDLVCVTWETGEVVLRNVRPQETIHRVKMKIHELFHVQPVWISLTCEHKQLNVDTLTFEDYNIDDGSQVIFTLRAIPVQILMLSGKTFRVNVYRKSTLKHIKSWIEQKVGIPKKVQRIYHNGIEMKNGDVCEDYNIDDHSVLYLK
ncbi:polyubiquitin-C-like [Saccoglossus kowalevskii]|uniref:Polyubiquitin-A-like n=1 Tax=Saccoglossus kowalevskii TaxID=10224 RepID=A0ABM0GPK9_SACKO|nr:PREDICTED: polyubiquitin-A-like [Saccoglossus kowalevskii]